MVKWVPAHRGAKFSLNPRSDGCIRRNEMEVAVINAATCRSAGRTGPGFPSEYRRVKTGTQRPGNLVPKGFELWEVRARHCSQANVVNLRNDQDPSWQERSQC